MDQDQPLLPKPPSSPSPSNVKQRLRRQRERVVVGHRPVALDGGYGWVIVLGSFLIHVFTDGFVYSFGVLADSLIEVFLLFFVFPHRF
jgi:hypothetical protein